MVTTPAAGYVSLLAVHGSVYLLLKIISKTLIFAFFYFLFFSLFQLSDVLSEPIALSISGNIFMALVSGKKVAFWIYKKIIIPPPIGPLSNRPSSLPAGGTLSRANNGMFFLKKTPLKLNSQTT